MMAIPSIVGVRPPTSSIRSLRRSPPGARKEIAGVLSSDGVVPAVPPPWMGVRSWIVSLAEYTVRRVLVPVLRMSRMSEQGYGVHSYCQPCSGLNPSWLAVSACEKTKLGIGLPASPRFPPNAHRFDALMVRAKIQEYRAVGRVAGPLVLWPLPITRTCVYVEWNCSFVAQDRST